MGAEEPRDLTEVVQDVSEAGAKGKSKGAVEAGVDKVQELLKSTGKRDSEPSRRQR
jgi:hypothetical protein